MKIDAVNSMQPLKEVGISIGNRVRSDSGEMKRGANGVSKSERSGDFADVQDFKNEEVFGASVNKFNDDIMDKAIKQANKELGKSNRVIEMSVHDKTHTIIYKVCDSITGEVINEFPPEKIQDMIAKIWEIAGLFVDEKL